VIQAECKTEAYKLWDRLSAERDHYLDGVEAELRGVGP
jgi:hypothetical protein